jgi:hypothetical protein
MISKELIGYYFSFSIVLLTIGVLLNIIFLVITRNFSSQDFFKNDVIFIFFKFFANVSLMLVCILQIFIFYFFVDYTIRTMNVSFFYDILNYKTQSFFYGKLYEYHFSQG